MKTFLSRTALVAQSLIAIAYSNNLIPVKYAAIAASISGIIQAFLPRVQSSPDQVAAADEISKTVK